MSEVTLYKTKNGDITLDVTITDETVWLSMNQLAELFGRDKSVISRHINNIFKINELRKDRTVAKFATVQKEGTKEVKREIEYYNLDVILSVGYRVNSKEAICFRQWSTNILKQHLIQGYTLHKKRLTECGIKELEQAVSLLQKTLVNHHLVNDIGSEIIQLIISYAKTWHLLLAYDENRLLLPEKGKQPISVLDYRKTKQAIESLKSDLSMHNFVNFLAVMFSNTTVRSAEFMLANSEKVILFSNR